MLLYTNASLQLSSKFGRNIVGLPNLKINASKNMWNFQKKIREKSRDIWTVFPVIDHLWLVITGVILHLKTVFLCSYSAFLLFLGFLKLGAMRENRERKRPDKKNMALFLKDPQHSAVLPQTISPSQWCTPLMTQSWWELLLMLKWLSPLSKRKCTGESFYLHHQSCHLS